MQAPLTQFSITFWVPGYSQGRYVSQFPSLISLRVAIPYGAEGVGQMICRELIPNCYQSAIVPVGYPRVLGYRIPLAVHLCYQSYPGLQWEGSCYKNYC